MQQVDESLFGVPQLEVPEEAPYNPLPRPLSHQNDTQLRHAGEREESQGQTGAAASPRKARGAARQRRENTVAGWDKRKGKVLCLDN